MHTLGELTPAGPRSLALPSAPKQFLHYFERGRPPADQAPSATWRTAWPSPSAACARIPSTIIKFVCLSHNTLRGAAGGAVLLAELLCAEGYMD